MKQLSTETLLTELKRRCDGAYMGNWKLSLTSTRIKVTPMYGVRELMKRADMFRASEVPATFAAEKKRAHDEAQPNPNVDARLAESSNNEEMHEEGCLPVCEVGDGGHDAPKRAGLRFKKLVVNSRIVFLDDI